MKTLIYSDVLSHLESAHGRLLDGMGDSYDESIGNLMRQIESIMGQLLWEL